MPNIVYRISVLSQTLHTVNEYWQHGVFLPNNSVLIDFYTPERYECTVHSHSEIQKLYILNVHICMEKVMIERQSVYCSLIETRHPVSHYS